MISKVRVGGSLAVFLLLVGLVWWLFPNSQKSQWFRPGKDMIASGFSDQAIGGHSQSTVETLSDCWKIGWSLAASAGITYVGVLFEKSDQGMMNFKGLDSLVVDWESEDAIALRVSILVDQPGVTQKGKPISRRYLQIEGVPPKVRGRSSWPLTAFRPPAWWYRENHLPFDPAPQFLDRVVALTIENGETLIPDASDRVRLYGIGVVGKPAQPWPAYALMALGLAMGVWAGVLSRVKKSTTVREERSVKAIPLTPNPLAVPPGRGQQIQDYLESHYHHSELSLESMAVDLALSTDVLSREIRQVFQDTFKGVLNRLRLQEAQRLLRDSKMGIAEIAYKVGYGNVSHFNRVAKDAWGKTPTEERASSQSI